MSTYLLPGMKCGCQYVQYLSKCWILAQYETCSKHTCRRCRGTMARDVHVERGAVAGSIHTEFLNTLHLLLSSTPSCICACLFFKRVFELCGRCLLVCLRRAQLCGNAF